MADVENQQESSFPVKRKSDLYCQDQENVANKAQKLQPSSNSEAKDGEVSGIEVQNLNSTTEEKIEKESEKDENGVAGDLEAEEEEEDDDDEEEEVDRKGKGISREDKGKGKMIEVEESDEEEDTDDDDDDDLEFGDEDDESDLSDDPLAEVDLDNILPSRTRRRSTQPGVYISNDRAANVEDDDSSDDSDA